MGTSHALRKTAQLSTTLAVLLLLATSEVPDAQGPEQLPRDRIDGREVAADRIILKMRPGTSPGVLDDIARQAGSAERRPINARGHFVVRSARLRVRDLLARFSAHPDVEYAEPDYIVRSSAVPNDEGFARQWGLRNATSPGIDIHATEAWNLAKGSSRIVIGVSDTTVDLGHSDLTPNLWTAPRPFTVHVGGNTLSCPAGSHGILLYRFSLVCDTSQWVADHHGTHVAGIAGAAGNNRAGTAGVNWNASLMTLAFMENGFGTISDAITVLEFAIQVKSQFAGTGVADVRVINASWGDAGESHSLREEIEYLGGHDVLFVAAAMNNAQDLDQFPSYPASYQSANLVTVGASTSTDSLAGFSNFGRSSVHLVAPGQQIYSTLPGGCQGCASWGYLSGTSMAAPFVSGAAALVLSRCRMRAIEAKMLLLDSVDRRPQFEAVTSSGGRLNVGRALQVCAASAPPAAPDVTLTAPFHESVYLAPAAIPLQASASDVDGSIAAVEFYAGSTPVAAIEAAPYRATWANVPQGVYRVRAVAVDDSGLRSESNAVTVTVAAGSGWPSPWANADIGDTGQIGSATLQDGHLAVRGAGAGLGEQTDAFHFAYQPLPHQGEFKTRIGSVDPRTYAGITYRETLSIDAAHATLAIEPSGFIEFVSRLTSPSPASVIRGPQKTVPVWLRLVRTNSMWRDQDTITALFSDDGRTWTAMGSAVIKLGTNALAGFVASSQDRNVLGSATFDNVAMLGRRLRAPGIPTMPSPTNGATGVTTSPLLRWTSVDATQSLVRLDPTNPPATAFGGLTPYLRPPQLAPNTTYFWQVVATNAAGTTSGPVWSFTTEGPAAPLPSPWSTVDVGETGQPGSALSAAGQFSVTGAGADIWGTADAFRYVYRPLNGDGQIVARLASLEHTHSFAKAGVMIRASLEPNASHVLLDLRPGGAVEFMTRRTAGGNTTFLAGGTRPPPGWLKLRRTGATVEASVSADGTAWSVVGNTTVTFSAPALVGLVVSSHDPTQLNTAVFEAVTVSTTPRLPHPWTSRDVGSTGKAGSASFANNRFAVHGAGGDIWGTTDGFHYVYQPLTGDGQIVARVASLQTSHSFAKAGVMIRETLGPGSAHVMLDVRPGGALEFMTRRTTGGMTTFLAGGTRPPPAWLKLRRSGSTIAASVSIDGQTWTVVGTTTTTLSATALIGFLVCSHDTAELNAAAFDGVAVSSGVPSPWTSSDIGVTGVSGSTSFADGRFTARGAGADIWGSADSFHYVYRPVGGDGQIIARLASLQNTHAFAKAGVMIRASPAANAAHVVLDVRPGGGVEFMTRRTTGGITTFLAGGSRPPPAFLKLQRSGSTVTASVSIDGQNWTTVGSTTTTLSSSALIGFFVCSHDGGQLNTAVFDGVSVSSASLTLTARLP